MGDLHRILGEAVTKTPNWRYYALGAISRHEDNFEARKFEIVPETSSWVHLLVKGRDGMDK